MPRFKFDALGQINYPEIAFGAFKYSGDSKGYSITLEGSVHPGIEVIPEDILEVFHNQFDDSSNCTEII